MTSQQVSWWTVHEFATARIQQVDHWPMIGTPLWCELHGNDPVKWAAILDAAVHWALRLETSQQAQADAAKAISAGADWPALAREINRRTDFYAARPWLRRAAS